MFVIIILFPNPCLMTRGTEDDKDEWTAKFDTEEEAESVAMGNWACRAKDYVVVDIGDVPD